MKYKVIKNRLLTPTVRSVVLKSESNVPFVFEPGQYVAISMYKNGRPTTTRCFSITSSPTQQRSIEICARVKGKYTTAMSNLVYGDGVTVRGPFGRFVFDKNEHKNLVLFAGGIGITPFMSMIRYATDLGVTNKIHLIYSNHRQADAPFLGELLDIEKKNPHFRATFVVGRLDEATFLKLGLNFSAETCMICGPAPYIEAMRLILSSHQVPQNRILSEAFSQGKHEQSDTIKYWPYNMYALAGLSLSLAIFFVTASDLLKTLPTLKQADQTASIKTEKVGNLTTIKPQVSTDITQKPIIRHVASVSITPKAAPLPPAPTIVIIPPSPSPVPTTVTPTRRPRTRVS